MATSPRVQLFLNSPRWLLYQSGWGLCRSSSAFQPAQWDETARNIGYSDGRWVPGSWPESFWLEPETGTLMLTPSPLRRDFATDSDWAPYYVPLTDFRWAMDGASPYDYFEEVVDTSKDAEPRMIYLKRESATAMMVGLEDAPAIDANLVDFGLDALGMVWAIQTVNPLAVNEGFSLLIRPYGIDTDIVRGWYAVAFGQVWLLLLGMNGQAELWERTRARSGSTAASWIKRATFEYSTGDPQGGKPFRLTIIPWGIDCLGFYFSQAPTQGRGRGASDMQAQPHGYLYRINAHRDGSAGSPYTRVIAGGFEKTLAGPVSLGMQAQETAYSFGMAKVRYKGDTFHLVPEMMDQPRRYVTLGQIDARLIGYAYGGSSQVTFSNERSLSTFTPATDYQLAFHVEVEPGAMTGSVGIYSPEIWALECDIPAVAAQIPAGSEVDLSPYWSSLAWEWSTRLEESTLTVKLNRSWDWRQFFKLDGSLELIIDGYTVWIGQIESFSPSLEGSVGPLADEDEEWSEEDNPLKNTQVVQDEIVAVSDWRRLNREAAGNASSFTAQTVGAIFEKALNRAGVPDSEQITDGEVDLIEVDNWNADYAHRTPKDLKMPSEDASWGDVCRALASRVCLQNRDGIRLLPIGSRWYRYVVPEFDPDAFEPTLAFFLSTDALPEGLQGRADAERWQGADGIRWFRILGGDPTCFDASMQIPEFNSLAVHGATSSAAPAEALSAFIAPHPRMLEDPDYIDFTGYQAHRTIGPQEAALAVTPNEVERMARYLYDLELRSARTATVDAEWQPVRDETGKFSLVPDALVWVVGRAPYAVEEKEILAGELVSFGVWRILSVDPVITKDVRTDGADDFDPDDEEEAPPGTQFVDLSFTWTAAYALQYAGVYETEAIPMFTDRVPTYGRPSNWSYD